MSINARKGHKGFHTVPLEPRFWAKVDRRGPDECWEWRGTKDANGYGLFTVKGRGAGRNKRAHRMAWELHFGRPFPSGMFGCHSCDNPSCVNPRHVWPGTNADNMRDMVAKGRCPGAAQTHCKRGHEFNDENTNSSRGYRHCRVCDREKQALRRRQLKQMEMA